MAASTAGTRTLVISTDPAPSLGDAFGQRLAAAPRPVPVGRGRALHAAEIDASRALERWLAGRRAALERVALRGTWFDEEDITRLLRLSLPGIDEIAALLELSRVGESGRYDLIVVDTAPTGHTLRMLGMPEALLGVARLFDRMQMKHRVMVEALRGRWQPDDDDLLIDGMAREARDLADMLRDPERVTMTWVSIAEPMAVEETVDAGEALAAQGIPLVDVILNRLTPEPSRACRWCDARRAFEASAIRTLRRRLGRLSPPPVLRALVARDAEPTGVLSLASIGADLTQRQREGAGTFAGKVPAPSSVPRTGRTVVGAAGPKTLEGAGTFPAKLPAPVALVMFGGKGGVGKTTCAAAAGIAAARARPDRRVMLISTDPAHSLADALGVPLSDSPRRLPGGPRNLQARELDASAAFARVRDKYRAAIDALFDRFSRTASFDAGQDRTVMQDLIDLAPPGIDELAAVIDVVDALEEGIGANLVLIDTAPSGHALRLLEMPGLVQEWARALMAIMLKYQPVVGVGELGAILLRLSQGLGRLRTLLADPHKTHFVIVTRAAALPHAESIRLLKRLSKLRIYAPTMIVNALGAGECPRCRRQREHEARAVTQLRRALKAAPQQPQLIAAPAWMPPPHGHETLGAWQGSWRAFR